MNFLPDLLSDDDIERAKKRVWNKMESRLEKAENSALNPVFQSLKKELGDSARLKKVMLKERLLDQLPDRQSPNFFFNKKLFAGMTLSLFVAFFTVPVFSIGSSMNAKAFNFVETVHGELLLNGTPVQGSAFVKEGDTLISGSGAIAHLSLQDGTRLTLGPRTQLDLESLNEEIFIKNNQGRIWTQFVNSSNPYAYFSVGFPGGSVVPNQRASFDLEVQGEDAVLQVAENLVEVKFYKDVNYLGNLSQGSKLLLTEEFSIEPIASASDVWWEFNEAYGRTYVSSLSESELVKINILPDNPLYFLKSWREKVQEKMAFGEEAKKTIIAKHIEYRLAEAELLFEKGKTEEAKKSLEAYKEAVGKNVEVSGSLSGEFALMEAQNKLLAKLEIDENSKIIEEALLDAHVSMVDSIEQKNEIRILTASQKLARVPALIQSGQYEQAKYYLDAYKAESLSIISELQNVPLEERENLLKKILDQKIKDLQVLRVIASMPEFTESLDANAQIVQELSAMILSLRERALGRLDEFFASTDQSLVNQYEIYDKLKESVEVSDTLNEQFEVIENALLSEDTIQIVEPSEEESITIDPRFE